MHLGPERRNVEPSTLYGQVFVQNGSVSKIAWGELDSPIVYTTRTSHKFATHKCDECLSSTISLFANLRWALIIIAVDESPTWGKGSFNGWMQLCSQDMNMKFKQKNLKIGSV